jgi:hypothetical protein
MLGAALVWFARDGANSLRPDPVDEAIPSHQLVVARYERT